MILLFFISIKPSSFKYFNSRDIADLSIARKSAKSVKVKGKYIFLELFFEETILKYSNSLFLIVFFVNISILLFFSLIELIIISNRFLIN